MNVYLVNLDGNHYQSLEPVDDGFVDKHQLLEFNCQPKAADWKQYKVFIPDPALKPPDFWEIYGAAFAMEPRVLDFVLAQCEMSGEILPLKFEKRTLSVVNVLQCWNCLDHNKTKWLQLTPKTRIIDDSKKNAYAFIPARMDEPSLFKLQEDRFNRIYCVERERDPETEFKAAVEKHKLKGILFDLLWSDEKKKSRK